MLSKLWSHKIELLLVFVLTLLFVLIRVYQKTLFYDPFLTYFEYDYLYKPFPKYDSKLLYLNLIYRFGLNSLVSIGVIYVFFKNKSFLKLSILVYLTSLMILLLLFYIVVNSTTYSNYQYLFYVRRFLIQPLHVMLLVPAFYFQKKHVHL